MPQRICFAVCGITVLLAATAEAGDRPPNILLIFADDLGWGDVGHQRGQFFETPNIDRLADQGMRFTDAYASAGNCAPSRACLLSGLYTPRHHVFAVISTNRGPKELMRLQPVPNRNGLESSFVTVAEALKDRGYSTGVFGKWHLARSPDEFPSAQGFDVVFNSFGDEEIRETKVNHNRAGPPDDPKGVYTLTREALKFMEHSDERPFFCFLSHHAVHDPLQADPKVLERFRAKHNSEAEAMYAACTHALDYSIGRLLAGLDRLGLANDTLVVFTSDNGGSGFSQEPLRGKKGCYYEGGVRVPMIVRWPGRTQPGSLCSTPVSNVDLYPTFLEVAGAAPGELGRLDGESLTPLLEQSAPLKRSAIFWHFPGYLDGPVPRGRDQVFRTRPVSVVRRGDWKLHLYHEEWVLDGGRDRIATNSAVELYNLADDLGEHRDVATSEPAVRDRLLNDLVDWLADTDAPLPTRLD